MKVTLNQLECFRAVAHRRHFAKAAETLGRTQPALSVQIQRLETEMGVTLFERTGKIVQLTAAGEILLPYSDRILGAVDEAAIKMAEVHGGTLGHVRIGTIPTVAAHFLPSVLRDFRARFPNVTVLLREEGRTPGLVALLENHEIDLSIGLEPRPATGLKFTKLLVEEFCVAVSQQHPLSSLTSVPISRLRREPFILYKTPGHHNREIILQYCRNAGFEPDVAFESEQAETIQNLVASNLGITLLPHMVLQHRKGQNIAMVRIEPPTPRRSVVAAWRIGRYLSVNARQFLVSCETIARSLGPRAKAR
jgi:DNA-binding transcriptional LysR family regulator